MVAFFVWVIVVSLYIRHQLAYNQKYKISSKIKKSYLSVEYMRNKHDISIIDRQLFIAFTCVVFMLLPF